MTFESVDAVLIAVAILLAVASLAFLVTSLWAVRKRTVLSFPTLGSFAGALLFFAFAALFGTLAMATQGYRALTREEVAAVVQIEPVGNEHFRAHFVFPDGEKSTFNLAGNEFYVDAHILKWKPIANFFGLHTSYDLDRVAGRYTSLRDEQTKIRTVFSLSRNRPFDIFQLRKAYPFFDPLLDVEYGSATFSSARQPATFEVRVSTTGLLLREVKRSSKLNQATLLSPKAFGLRTWMSVLETFPLIRCREPFEEAPEAQA